MPCHWGSPELPRRVPDVARPAASACPAVGCAEAGRYLLAHPEIAAAGHPVDVARDEITYVSLGEGATSQGEFWESLNTACVERLPMLFVVADNGWAISVPSHDQQPAPVVDLVRGFAGLEMTRIDGTDYAEVREIGRQAIDHLRAGGGPVLLHADVTRPYSHSAADTQSKYRSPEDLEAEKLRDPITRMGQLCVEHGRARDLGRRGGARRGDGHRRGRGERGAGRATARPGDRDPPCGGHPGMADGERPPCPRRRRAPSRSSWPTRSVGASHELMVADPRVRVFGEDVADAPSSHVERVAGKGGVFGTTLGLQATFGADRCFNAPLAEANIVGRAIGQAVRGLRPIPEIQFFDYIWTAMQQLKTEAATLRWRSDGHFSAPMIVRVPIGGYLVGGSIWHSQSGESIFAHVPGLLVAMPSRASDAVGLLRAAARVRGPGPVPRAQAPVPPALRARPVPGRGLARAVRRGVRVRRTGDDVTIVTWGATVQKSIEAADRVARRRPGRLDRGHRPPHDHPVGPPARGRLGRAHRSAARRARGHPHRRVRRRDRGLGRRRVLRRPAGADPTGRRARHPRGLLARCSSRWCCPRSTTSSTHCRVPRHSSDR